MNHYATEKGFSFLSKESNSKFVKMEKNIARNQINIVGIRRGG